MSLKSDFLDGSTGLTQKLADARDAGAQYVADNLASLSTALKDNAAKGLSKFTVTLPVTFQPANLRLQGLIFKSFVAGVVQALGDEDVYDYEVEVKLNTTDQVETKLDFLFDFRSQ